MAATDGQIVVAAARWSDDACYLREFVGKHRLPAVIKITKGQYGGLGVPTLPAPGLQSTALLVSAGRRRKILAQAVKIKEGRRVVGVGPRLAIPDSYPGYFEILSEEGRAARGIESVAELARRCPESGALLRESVRALGCRQDEETGALVAESSRSVPAGETIQIVGEVTLPGRGKFLRCQDARGDGLLLPMDQRSRFSALAREDSIGGVHTARALLAKRLPLTVRLVHGQGPRGLKSASQFLPELRLLSSFEEEHVFALPLSQRDGAAAALPLAAPLKLTRARNEEALRVMPEFARLVERAGRLVAEVVDRAHALEGRLGEGKPTRASRATATAGFLRPTQRVRVHAHHHHHGVTALITRDENRAPPINGGGGAINVFLQSNGSGGTGFTEDYDEIDQIYDYVRGFAPLPRQNRCYEQVQLQVPAAAPLDDRPEPPPIETIPTKKNQAEKRTRRQGKEHNHHTHQTSQSVNGHHHQQLLHHQQQHCQQQHIQAAIMPILPVLLPSRPEKPPLAKLYVKNSGGTQRSRALSRQKSASPLKETPPGFKGGSPLFNIRYKSLTNLQQAMELDGTLDSSHSGGRTSGDSGAGAKLPEKRSRRLSRPRSLTNLVWELRGGNGMNCSRPETPPTVATVAPLPPTKCGQRLAVTVVTPRRVGTLYL